MILWSLFAPAVIPQVDTLWPTSVFGWVGGISGAIALSFVISDRLTGRGKNLQVIASGLKDLDTRVTDIENTDKIIDATLRSMHEMITRMDYELRGPDGANGMKAAVKALRVEVEKIQERNRKMDLLAARFQQMMSGYDGPERRAALRGLKDLFGGPGE